MTLITITDGPTFTLRNAHLAYAMRVNARGVLEHLCFGPSLAEAPPPLSLPLRHCTVMLKDHETLSLNDLPQEYATAGQGDFSAPALHLGARDNSVLGLRYKSHALLLDKPPADSLPTARGNASQTLCVTLQDAVQQIEVDLFYTIWNDHGVIARRSVIRNVGSRPVSLRQVASTALDLSPGEYSVQHFHGSWAREFNEERLSLPTGRFTIESTRGTSSNAHMPYLALIEADATEVTGRCYGMTLIYSGNYSISVERGEFGRIRLLAGLNDFDFDWTLEPGEDFVTPEALHGFSPDGLGGLSHVWHDFIRAKITPERFRDTSRPTYLNTWEAAYFDVSEQSVLQLADEAADLGVEMLVLDDGWFKGRTDDRRALGDWIADPERFPSGIPALAQHVRDRGLKFGIWLEPEMVSPDSSLYRAHPDWAISAPGRDPSRGRHQLTLDLSKAEVVDHIHAWLDALLASAPIDYVKWDMNRNMTDLGSGARAHRYMLGLYRLLGRLTQDHPDVIFETCASGGNRFDLGMLSYMPQGWISDMCDPVGRLDIINGASHLFPPDVMAAYIGPSPNHQNGRISSLSARYMAGLPCAAHGISLGLADIARSRPQLQQFMGQSGKSAADRLGSRFDRLRKTAQETIWQQTSRDCQTVYLIAFQVLNAPNLPIRQVRLRGLEPMATYILQDGRSYKGNQLMHYGLPLDQPTEDFSAELLILKKVS